MLWLISIVIHLPFFKLLLTKVALCRSTGKVERSIILALDLHSTLSLHASAYRLGSIMRMLA